MTCLTNDCNKSILSLGKQCNDCNNKPNCTEENLAYFVSQEFVNKILANVEVNELDTHNKSIVKALLELNKELDLKQDHSAKLDVIDGMTIAQINQLVQFGGLLK